MGEHLTTRRGKAETLAIETHFWRQVDILDTFWQRTFIVFVEPMAEIYSDPISAGVAILSRYLESPTTILHE